MRNISEEQTVRELLLGLQADRATTVGRAHGVRVNSHKDVAVGIDISETGSSGRGAVDVFDEPVSGIRPIEEVPCAEEVGAIKGD